MLVFIKIKDVQFLSGIAAVFLFSSLGVASIEVQEEEADIKIYPAGTHEINSLTGPDLETLKPVKGVDVPENRRELYNTALGFLSHFIWQDREELLYKLPDEEGELYKGVRINLSFKTEKKESITVVENTGHPSFVTQAGENPVDYWVEFSRQKNLCFMNDLWAALLPCEGVRPSRDFYIVLKRLAQDLLSPEFLDDSFLQETEKLEILLKDLSEFYAAQGTSARNRPVEANKVYNRLLNWSMCHLTDSS